MNKCSSNTKKVVSIDIGATSGRVMEVDLIDEKLTYHEIKRFKNKVILKDKILYWDINYLISQILEALELISENVKSLAISTWGCDICLIDKFGNLIDNPRCYRDENNLLIQKEFSSKHFSYQEVYQINGIQDLPFNTIYQLTYLHDYENELFKKIDKVLMIPDYLAYVLTGKMRNEETNASTTALYDGKQKAFSVDIADKLPINLAIFSSLIFPGESYGLLKEELSLRFNLPNLEVIACATHDTGSAVRGSLADNTTAYLSSGTWSLMGALIDEPIINFQAMQENYTNEIAYNSKIRFLKNIMGMWILEEYRRELEKEQIDNSFETILKEFAEPTNELTLIDPDDELFLPVGKMSTRINEYAKKTKQVIPKTRKNYIQTIYYSLAYKYRLIFEKLQKLTGKEYSKLNIVGGGAKNNLLSQLVADVLQIEVISGPIEATVLGNAIVQFLHYGDIKEEQIYNLIFKSDHDIKIFKPNLDLKKHYDQEYKKFLKILEETNG